MFTHNLTKLMAVVMLLASTSAIYAQTLIWGAGHPTPAIDSLGKFASSDGTIAGTGWTAAQVLNGNWVWSATGISQGSFSSGQVQINSPSLSDGVAFFDSDLYYDQNLVPQEATLTSPVIDLTGYADSTVVLKFYCGLRNFASDDNVVRFSIDGGTTWAATLDARTFFGTPPNGISEGQVLLNLTSALAGATNLTNCVIQFYFKGDSYYYAVDDVVLETTIPFTDLAADAQNPPIRVLGSAELPIAFVNDIETNWGANVRNTGLADVVAGEAKLYLQIDRDQAGTWVLEAEDSISLPAIDVAQSYPAYKTSIGTANWLPTQIGRYRVYYIVKTSTVTQSTEANDTIVDFFTVTNNDYLSKVPRDLIDGYPDYDNGTLATADQATGDLPVEHEFGYMFFVPPGVTGMRATSLKYRAASGNLAAGAPTFSVIQGKVYKFIDSNGDGFWTQAYMQNDPELPLQGLGVDTFPLTAALSYGEGDINLVNTAGSFDPFIPLDANSFYVVTLLQVDPNGLRNAANDTRAAYFGFMDYHYEATTDSMPTYYIPASVFRRVRRDGTGALIDNSWFAGYSNGNAEVASLGVVISSPTSTDLAEEVATTADFELFPNPASNDLTVKVEFEETMPTVQYIITDASGRVVIMHTTKNIQQDVMNFDIKFLPAGMYFITVRTDKTASAQKFIKK